MNATMLMHNMVVFITSAMDIENTIGGMISRNGGWIGNKMIEDLGIPPVYLSRYVKKHGLIRVNRGIYAEANWPIDPYLVFQYAYPRFVYSLNSAVYLHGLSDAQPNFLEVTGPLNYRPFPKAREGVFTHTDTVAESYCLGIIEVRTEFGNIVRAYDMEKTICDLIRNKRKVDFELYAKALNGYAKSINRDVGKLMRYAKAMKMQKQVRDEIEVILNIN